MGLQEEFDALLESKEPLNGLDQMIWEQLTSASQDYQHPWRLGSISTVNVKEGVPQSRTVVLRHADVNGRLVECHTDARSGKVAQIDAGEGSSQACWLFYEASTRIQLRLNGLTHVIDGNEADRAWKATPLRSRAAYLSVATPGKSVDGPLPPDTSDRQTSIEQSERGRKNFRIVRSRIDSVDILYLRSAGHVRAKIEYPTDSSAEWSWVVP